MKTISIKLTKVGPHVGPFSIYTEYGDLIAQDVPRKALIQGMSYRVNNNVKMIKLLSTGSCTIEKTMPVTTISDYDFHKMDTTVVETGCIWVHLKNKALYNNFYGKIEPYVVEYPFGYEYFDQILQNVKDYTRVNKYLPDPLRGADETRSVQTDNIWFNKAILYNGQQCSGLLELVPKPKNDLRSYVGYPKFNLNSKTITYTKSDNFYQYNTFWSVVKDKNLPLFIGSCKSLSIDKELNQDNMDYTSRSFKKEPLRAKNLVVRHILDNRSDVHMISQFIVAPSQISYK